MSKGYFVELNGGRSLLDINSFGVRKIRVDKVDDVHKIIFDEEVSSKKEMFGKKVLVDDYGVVINFWGKETIYNIVNVELDRVIFQYKIIRVTKSGKNE